MRASISDVLSVCSARLKIHSELRWGSSGFTFAPLFHGGLMFPLPCLMLRLKPLPVCACLLLRSPQHIYTWITASRSLLYYQTHTQTRTHMQARALLTNRVEEVGSVVCLCMRCVRRRKCSLMDSCTSVGMSGDVWLIFTAASRKPREPTGSFTFSVAMVAGGCWGLGSGGGGWSGLRSGPQTGLRDELG